MVKKSSFKGLDENNLSLVKELGKEVIKSKYGNLFQMYEKLLIKIRMKLQ